jgi:hypothetical protein
LFDILLRALLFRVEKTDGAHRVKGWKIFVVTSEHECVAALGDAIILYFFMYDDRNASADGRAGCDYGN